MAEYSRRENENLLDYFVRLFENKKKYGLKCTEIADILNEEYGVQYTESKWRKDWALFNAGRKYERSRVDSDIATRILTLSDFHVPYNLPISTFQKYAGNIDLLVLNGDIGDCQAISKFPKTYRNSPMEELVQTRTYLIDLIEYIAPKKVIVLYGNHDIRFQSYFAKNLDTDLLELMPRTSLELIFEDGFHHYDKRTGTKVWYEPLNSLFDDTCEIKYEDNWFTKVGDCIFAHPIAFSSGTLKTAEKAMNYFKNEGYEPAVVCIAHTHKVGETKIGGTTIIEQGCCCDTEKLNYMDGKLSAPQKEGYAYLAQDKDGNTLERTIKIEKLN